MSQVRRGTILSFDSATWLALVQLDGADSEAQMPVGQWVPSAMLAASAEVAVLVFGDTNTDDGIVLGPYGSVSLWDYPGLTGLTTGQVLRAISATAAAFGALDLANANAVTGLLPFANLGTTGTWTPTYVGTGTAGTFTYTNQTGTYAKFDKWVYIYGRCDISAITGAPTGNITIAGLPFTSEASNFHALAFSQISNLKYTAGDVQLLARVGASATVIQLVETFTNAGAAFYPAASFTNAACSLLFSGWYRTP